MEEKLLEKITVKLIEICNPVSVFVYGSRARNDFSEKSDYEIGVLIPKKRYVRRSKIKKAILLKSVSIYPFEYEDFKRGKLDTPFNPSLFLRELLISGKTIYGKDILRKMKLPAIKVVDIIQDLRFNLGYAFAAMHSFRNGDKFTASYEFYKSCLYGTRCLEILKLKKFPSGYKEIKNLSKKLRLKEYESLIEKAYKVRIGKNKLEEDNIFQNISYLNEMVEREIMKFYSKNGNKILIE